jgi:2',3'-cyclic-nucleotide 2'-phosphodiesterase (5'-nucleotidase family)
MVDSLRAPFRDTLETVIATAAERIGRQYKSPSPVDMLAANILLRTAHADVAFLPGLGFGVTIQPGPITREMVVGLFPHPTSVIHERLLGRQIRAILEQTATNLRPANELDRVGGMIQTSGLRWTIDLTKPQGHRISGVYVGARALDDTTLYAVVTNGGLLQGTHRQTTFAEGLDIVRDARPFAVVLEEELRRMQTIHAPPTNAVTLIK